MEPASSLLAFQHPHPPLFSSSLPLRANRIRRLSLIANAGPEDGKSQTNSNDSSVSAPKKPSEGGSGFGSVRESKKKRKGKERRSVIRRTPIERPSPLSQVGGEDGASKKQQGLNEGAFLLAWLGLGLLILVEGVALAASGFLPEEWDKFFVKYLYPSFTPTVCVFLGGTVAYGVYRYLESEKLKKN